MKNQGDSEVLPPLLHRHPRVLTRADTDNGAPVAQRGSVIIWILVLVALFGMLSFVVSQGSRTGAGQITQEKANLLATEIITSANTINQAVKTLLINGCTDSNISFQNSVITSGYTNASSPANKSCHVFEPAGGGVSYPTINLDAVAKIHPETSFYGKAMFTGRAQVVGMGTDCAANSCNELIMSFGDLTLEVCNAINKKLDIPYAASEQVSGWSWASGNFFSGFYPFNSSGTGSYIGNQDGNILTGKKAGCLKRNDLSYAPGYYEFYQVLIAR